MTKQHNGFKIEKGIPMPARHGNARYPWREMEIGDSFLINKDLHLAIATAQTASGRTGMQFKAKRSQDGVRVWRVG